MNKGEFIDKLSHRLGDKKTSTAAVDAVVTEIQNAVSAGDNVNISGFGVFEKRDRAARTARNPQTGERMQVKKTTVPAFRPGTTFKDMLSSGSSRYGSSYSSSYSGRKNGGQQAQAHAKSQPQAHAKSEQSHARTHNSQPQARIQRSQSPAQPAAQARTTTRATVTRSAPQAQASRSQSQSQPRAQAQGRTQSQARAQQRQPRGQKSSYAQSSYGQTRYARGGGSPQGGARMVVK
jgi:DNA-binding protein HU-beta